MRLANISLLAVATAILVQTGCSSTPAKSDHDPVHARTFNFVKPGPQPQPVFTKTRTATHELIQATITKDFADRGVARVASGSDLTVEYLIIIGDATTTDVIDDYFGQGGDAGARQARVREVYASANERQFLNASTLVIDIVDTKTQKLLARQQAKRPFRFDITPGERSVRTREMVDEIVQKLNVMNPK